MKEESNLVIVSEIDNWGYYFRRGIYPKEFYTDFLQFKERSAFFTEMVVLFVFAGACHFPKHQVLELITNLKKRSIDTEDSGIKEIYVASDSYLPQLEEYYLYRNYLKAWKKVSHLTVQDAGSDFWKEVMDYKNGSKGSTSMLFDKKHIGDTAEIIECFKKIEPHSDDRYIPLIAKASFKN